HAEKEDNWSSDLINHRVNDRISRPVSDKILPSERREDIISCQSRFSGQSVGIQPRAVNDLLSSVHAPLRSEFNLTFFLFYSDNFFPQVNVRSSMPCIFRHRLREFYRIHFIPRSA